MKSLQVSQMQRTLELSLPSEVIKVLKGHYHCHSASFLFFIQPRILVTKVVSVFLRLGLPQQQTVSQATNE